MEESLAPEALLVDVASAVWPAHAEMCSPEDWNTLSEMARRGDDPESRVLRPMGEAKDEVIASLMILYWTMRACLLTLQVARDIRQTSDLRGMDRVEAILELVLARLSPATPIQIRERVREIVVETERTAK